MATNKTQTDLDKPLLHALKGGKEPYIPCWFMRQAGRYLPEYRDLRKTAGGFLDMVYNPDFAAEVTMQPIRRFGMDAAILFSDILVIPHALGQHLEFVPGTGPKLDPVRDEAALAKLSAERLDRTLGPVYDTVKTVRAMLSAEGFPKTALIGFAGAPWTVATYMVEGAGSKDYQHVKKWAYADEKSFSRLIDLVTEATIHYLQQQIAAGAEAIQIFDSWAGVLDEAQFEKWSLQPTQKIVAALKETAPDIAVIGFPKGAGILYQRYARQSGVDAVSLDAQMPLRWATENLQSHLPVQGNLDPVCLLAGGKALEDSAHRILNDLSVGPFVFNLGHGVIKETPPEHVAKLVEIIRTWSA